MVKHTQTNRQQQPTNYLSVFDYFVGLALKGLSRYSLQYSMLKPLSEVLRRKAFLHMLGIFVFLLTANSSPQNRQCNFQANVPLPNDRRVILV